LLAEKYIVSGGLPAEKASEQVDKLLAATKAELVVFE